MWRAGRPQILQVKARRGELENRAKSSGGREGEKMKRESREHANLRSE
jgi:hypothetical protein